MWLIPLIILLQTNIIISDFSPDTTNYDAYGLKIAVNDVLFVEAYGDYQIFLVQYAPYNYTNNSLYCAFYYDDPTHYVYSVNVGIKQNTTLDSYFYFAGEVLGQDSSGNNGAFIGIWLNEDPQTVQNLMMGQYSSCDNFSVANLQFLSSYAHQEFFVIAVEPYGNYAIGLGTDFAFIYQPFSNNNMTTKPSAAVWPNNTTFNPHAADASTTFTIAAGFAVVSVGSGTRKTPTVYLISNTNLTILSTWSYSATANSWQSRLTYSSISSWSSQYTMSVKINSDDPTRVLVGMPFLNTVFLFVISNNGTNLTLASSRDNGHSVGYGKSVTWLTTSQAAILVSTYSMDYSTWYSSDIYLYTSLNNTVIPSSPSAIIPNVQQPLPSTINSQLIQIISTPESLAALDIQGDYMLILAQPPGYYASTDSTNSPFASSMPVVSYPAICIGGTYKSDKGVHPCILCPSGTRNPVGVPGISCINCSSISFCPLGAVYEINSTLLSSLSQAYTYPRSPDMNEFEGILFSNMFSLGSTGHCLVVSPIFWILMLLIMIAILLIVMATLHKCVQPQTSDHWRTTVKNIFERTDLIGEGELWIGGLASIAIVLMIAMACAFSISFLNQYPSEKVGPSTFACDTTIRNAKFDSSLQGLSVPVDDEEQTIYDWLNDQNFTLQIDFINTAFSCMDLSISEVIESSTTSLNFLSCSNQNGTLSARVFLPEHDITIVATLNGIQLVGGIGMGLWGPSQQNDVNTLQELNFRQTFHSSWAGTLAQQPTIQMTLNKVINETEPLSGTDSIFGGIWYPAFTYSVNQMFVTAAGYVMSSNLTSTTLTIVIREASYYIKNLQSPIARLPDIIFRLLLFTILCLEISGLIFLIFKLLIIPLYNKIARTYCRKRNNAVGPVEFIPEHHD